jgi:hypothetical protein
VKEELWIGVVWLKPLPGAKSDILDGDVAGAFTNIVTWARDAASFRHKAETLAAHYNLYVVDIENAEPTSIRVLHSPFNEEIEDLIQQAETNPKAILFATIYQYPHEEA